MDMWDCGFRIQASGFGLRVRLSQSGLHAPLLYQILYSSDPYAGILLSFQLGNASINQVSAIEGRRVKPGLDDALTLSPKILNPKPYHRHCSIAYYSPGNAQEQMLWDPNERGQDLEASTILCICKEHEPKIAVFESCSCHLFNRTGSEHTT